MRKSQALIAGILAGIAAPSTLWATPEYQRVTGTDTSRMRGDVRKIGHDFAVVIKRKNGKTSSPSSSKAA